MSDFQFQVTERKTPPSGGFGFPPRDDTREELQEQIGFFVGLLNSGQLDPEVVNRWRRQLDDLRNRLARLP
jgi:hypothetical protein